MEVPWYSSCIFTRVLIGMKTLLFLDRLYLSSMSFSPRFFHSVTFSLYLNKALWTLYLSWLLFILLKFNTLSERSFRRLSPPPIWESLATESKSYLSGKPGVNKSSGCAWFLGFFLILNDWYITEFYLLPDLLITDGC